MTDEAPHGMPEGCSCSSSPHVPDANPFCPLHGVPGYAQQLDNVHKAWKKERYGQLLDQMRYNAKVRQWEEGADLP